MENILFDENQPSYERFREIYAERTIKLIVWVGAGLSTPANLPTWKELRGSLQREAFSKARTLDHDDAERKNKRLKSIENIFDIWLAFEKLKEELGETSYQHAVRKALTPRTSSIPFGYKKFWELRIGGMLTLNLDRFAALAHTEHRKSYKKVIHEIKGCEVEKSFHVLQSEAPFVVNLHGVLDDYSSWIFTKNEVGKLLSNEVYKSFLTVIFASKIVLFAGISADDIAAGGILAELKNLGINFGQHFWLTDRSDETTDIWAENNGIQIIRYSSKDGHEKVYENIFSDLKRFVPKEDKDVIPVVGPLLSNKILDLPLPNELAVQGPENIRKILSAHATKILSDRSDTIEHNIKKYEEFCKTYQRAIHNSWYVSDQPPENIFFGYEIKGRLGGGAFGNVYKATRNSEQFAIKLLREEVRNSPDMLGSFRRGVRSMRILFERNVKGMVPYKEAYELPSCAIMDFVDGPNLEEAVKSGQLDRWNDGLRIALEVAKIVRAGHQLPERVLHRDIRPANIMLRNFYKSYEDSRWEVVVLDFDLSWHRGSTEKSIDISSAAAALGYVAPEQIEQIKGISTRNAAVDSFGFAMTLLFLLSGRHPITGENYKRDWPLMVQNFLKSKEQPEWKSLPVRIARLIIRSTYREQNKRMDMGQIETELSRLYDALISPEEVQSAELWAEEVMRRAFPDRHYEWNPDNFQAELKFLNGLVLKITGDEVNRKVLVETGWSFSGDLERRNVDKFLPKAKDKGAANLRKNGWNVTNLSSAHRSIQLTAEVSVSILRANPEQNILSLKELPEINESLTGHNQSSALV